MKTYPLISVIMPVFNTEKYVAESIQSILQQTYSPIEIICVNDGSTDTSLEILKSFGSKIRLINNRENTGIANARNTGIRQASGDYIAFADADDIWKPEKLARQMKEFADEPLLDISFCLIKCFLSPDLPPLIKKRRHCPSEPQSGQISPTALIKKSSFDRVGELDPAYRVGEFIDWMARGNAIGLKSKVAQEVLFMRRIHETNTTAVNRSMQQDYLKIVKKALDQKRLHEKK